MKLNWSEYLSEFFGTAIMMAIGIGAVVFMWSAGSVMTEVIPSEPWRRLATGVLFAGGGTAVVLSPLGQRSGGHLNPAMTLAFWLRGKITHTDAAMYVLAQTLGAVLGVLIVEAVAGEAAATVNLGMTTPGLGYSATVALAAELVITFSLIFLVFWAVDRRSVAPFTPYLAGVLIAFLVMIEAPISGTSLNPARSLAPAALMGMFDHLWLYFVGPIVGAVLAVGVYRGIGGEKTATGCAKLHHTDQYPCLFEGCGYRRIAAGTILLREGGESDRAYVIRRGEVEVRKAQSNGQEAVIAQLGPGDWVGEMGLLLNLPRSASVVAVTDLEVEPLTRENFEHLIGAHPEEALRLLRQLATRLHQADQRQTL
ncbi:MAG: aquaporin [Gammaproteobacteria bacterium]|jgi:aquaporin Z